MQASLPRRVVITGIGLVSPLGCDLDAVWSALLQRRSGVRRIRQYDPSALPVQFGGEIDQFDPKQHIDKKDRKRLLTMPRTFQLGVVAAQKAVQSAGNLKDRVEPARF